VKTNSQEDLQYKQADSGNNPDGKVAKISDDLVNDLPGVIEGKGIEPGHTISSKKRASPSH